MDAKGCENKKKLGLYRNSNISINLFVFTYYMVHYNNYSSLRTLSSNIGHKKLSINI